VNFEENYRIGVASIFLVVLLTEYDSYLKVPYLEEEAIRILKAI
jgi:hypothetical protein